MTNGDSKGTADKTAKTDESGCKALLTVIGLILLSIFAPVFAVYGLITGQTSSLPGRADSNGNAGGHWYSRATQPGQYWFAEALWLLFAVLSIAIWVYVVWSIRQPDKKPTAPSGEPIAPEEEQIIPKPATSSGEHIVPEPEDRGRGELD